MIPVWINNRNRLATTRKMVEYLRSVPDALPIIHDNDSTYPPLLEWYKSGCDVEVVYRRENTGARGMWSLDLGRGGDVFVISDPDLDLSGVPHNLLKVLAEGLRRFPRVVKAGLSLEINDLPPGTKLTSYVLACESKYWKVRRRGWWMAPTDSTFAMYRASTKSWPGVRPAIRSPRPYTARHIPWYGVMDDEEVYYQQHADLRWASTIRGMRRNGGVK